MASWVRGKCIGKGSFGTVNLAINRFDNRVFAVKSVDCNSCFPDQILCLENEIRILHLLSSPYVVEFLGDDYTTSHRNLFMEYLPGGTVADVAGLDERIIRSYTRCLTAALMYVHSRGVVHCDVKGKNVLVSSAGIAKLADFGSAVEEFAAGGEVIPRGSPLWMAPEVIRGEYQGPESDVWSLGCTVIEMITGKPAWEDCGGETIKRIGFSDDLPEYPTRLSKLGCDFLDKCLQREPGRRWRCDQLMEHPFLSATEESEYSIPDSSPRCVLDWVNSEFDEEDESEEIGCSTFSGRERIEILARNSGPPADWESENWEVVRNWGGDGDEDLELAAAAAARSCGEDLGEGTSLVNQDSTETAEDKCRSEWRRPYWRRQVDLTAEKGDIGTYKLLLLLLLIIIQLHNIHIYFTNSNLISLESSFPFFFKYLILIY